MPVMLESPSQLTAPNCVSRQPMASYMPIVFIENDQLSQYTTNKQGVSTFVVYVLSTYSSPTENQGLSIAGNEPSD
jgi:hypothetical protein